MKKGFTLIELLAVIVILAIIALIATPIVLSIIEETKESAVLRSAEYYLSAVENSIMKKNLSVGGSFSPTTCVVQSDGNLLCDGTNELEIEVSGEKPSSGTITFEKGKIIAVELTQSNKEVTKNDKGELAFVKKLSDICKPAKQQLYATNPLEAGYEYECEVKPGTKYNFYVLSTEEDGTTNLIMDRNICEDGTPTEEGKTCLVAWINEGHYLEAGGNSDDWVMWENSNIFGPITAMTYLHNATKDWINVPDMIMNYEDENIDYDTQQKGTNGYGSIITTGTTTIITSKNNEETGRIENLKARMPMYKEVHGEGKCLTLAEIGPDGGSCPLWLGKVEISGIDGYWTLSSVADRSGNAWNIYSFGDLSDSCINDTYHGVRAVINLKI